MPSLNALIRRSFIALLACAPLAAPAMTVNTFDAGPEGWMNQLYTNAGLPVGGPGAAQWSASGGNPDGHIFSVDPGPDHSRRFIAPAQYLGDQSALLGRVLLLDVRVTPVPLVGSPQNPLVAIINAAELLGIAFLGADIGTTFEQKVIPIVSNGTWLSFNPLDPVASLAVATEPQITTVLANVAEFSIAGELIGESIDDTVFLDNVAIVPLPAAFGLLAAALSGFAFTRRVRSPREND